MKCSLIDEHVKKPSAYGMSTFYKSSVWCERVNWVDSSLNLQNMTHH